MKSDTSINTNGEALVEINNDINAKIKRHNNVDQNIITITEDKIELILIKHIKKIESKKSWMTPLGILISLLLIPITTENFRDFIISAEYWKELTHLGIISSAIWFIISWIKGLGNRNTSVESIIGIIKKSENVTQ